MKYGRLSASLPASGPNWALINGFESSGTSLAQDAVIHGTGFMLSP